MPKNGANTKTLIALDGDAITNGATATGNFDTLGGDYLNINVFLSASSATNNVPDVLKLSEADTTDGSFTDISGAVGGTDFTLPTSFETQDVSAGYAKFGVDLRGRKRYIKLTISPNTTQDIWAVGELQMEEDATDATGANTGVRVNI